MTEIETLKNSERKDFYKELLSLAIPIGLQNLLVALIGASDALMLGRLTQDAVAAVSLANQIVFIMNLFLSAVIGGGGALIAQYWVKGDRIMVKNLFCMILKWSFAISVVFFASAMLIPERLMRIYTPDTALLKIGTSYLRAVGISYLFSGITQCYYLKMKIEGTAYSTVAVEFIALIWCITESHRNTSIRPDIQGFKWFSASVTKDLLNISFPMLGSSLAWGLGFSMHSLIMGHLGSDATAAASITSVVQELITCVCKGISAGSGIMIGKLLGQNLLQKQRCMERNSAISPFGQVVSI